ncbi:carbohydrate-binding family 9-like protein [Paenibacillus taiwanensis]|uniref:carbohydrate-binding family 9-like protein n=1 Tax=Paenibacillus taiwanensis TaxID=401638 RepID=UPI0003F7DB2D|nr:carbohydrate-binding family 9-like protein [Paenibacillus taiwanensis]
MNHTPPDTARMSHLDSTTSRMDEGNSQSPPLDSAQGEDRKVALLHPLLPIYECRYMAQLPSDNDWDQMSRTSLLDVTTSELPRLTTAIAACWTTDAVHVRIYADDDYIWSPYKDHDDPLYEADVVEMFIDLQGTGERYYEFNVSPHNVVFDAMIQNNGHEPSELHPEWDAAELHTSVAVQPLDGGMVRLTYELRIPFNSLQAQVPAAGEEWRVNWFRIDQTKAGERSFWAWSPTGAVNFHVPDCFGRLRFM